MPFLTAGEPLRVDVDLFGEPGQYEVRSHPGGEYLGHAVKARIPSGKEGGADRAECLVLVTPETFQAIQSHEWGGRHPAWVLASPRQGPLLEWGAPLFLELRGEAPPFVTRDSLQAAEARPGKGSGDTF